MDRSTGGGVRGLTIFTPKRKRPAEPLPFSQPYRTFPGELPVEALKHSLS